LGEILGPNQDPSRAPNGVTNPPATSGKREGEGVRYGGVAPPRHPAKGGRQKLRGIRRKRTKRVCAKQEVKGEGPN